VLLLAIDTSTPQVGVAVCRDGEVLARRTVVDARRHGELLASSVSGALADAGLKPSELEGIAVGVGPGPYTGLRVGLMTARALGHALGVDVHGVCSHDALAAQAGIAGAPFEGELLAVTDARRKEVYWARYRDGVRVDGPAVNLPAEVAWDGPAVGAGAVLYGAHFPDARDPAYPDPAQIAAVAEAVLAAGGTNLPPDPLYLRRPDAVEPGERKPVGQPRVGDRA
jgi:tRNA threonylcarbamoyl adenosine modification protein YeaZ